MKYMGFWEYDWDEMSQAIESYKNFFDEQEQSPDKWPKIVMSSHGFHSDIPKLSKDVQGFVIVETDKQEQLINFRWFFAPYLKFKFVPLYESRVLSETVFDFQR